MSLSTQDVDSVVQQAIMKAMENDDTDEVNIMTITEEESAPLEGTAPSVQFEPENVSSEKVKIAAPDMSLIENPIPPPEIEIGLLQINTSYKLVSSIVDTLTETVLKLFSEKPSKEEFLANAMKIVLLVVSAVENIKKTGKVLKGIEKRDLAVAAVNGLAKRVIDKNEDIFTVYNLLIKPHIEDMIDAIIDTTRNVNNRYEQGNSGQGRAEKKKSFCFCF